MLSIFKLLLFIYVWFERLNIIINNWPDSASATMTITGRVSVRAAAVLLNLSLI